MNALVESFDTKFMTQDQLDHLYKLRARLLMSSARMAKFVALSAPSTIFNHEINVHDSIVSEIKDLMDEVRGNPKRALQDA